jgi:hypothetical protein
MIKLMIITNISQQPTASRSASPTTGCPAARRWLQVRRHWLSVVASSQEGVGVVIRLLPCSSQSQSKVSHDNIILEV